MADDASPSPMSFAPEPETSQSLASPVMDLERRLEQLQNSMETLQSSQSCQSIILEELRSLLLELKALGSPRKRTPPFLKDPLDVAPSAPSDVPILMSIPGQNEEGAAASNPEPPRSPSVRPAKKHAVSTLAKVSEELSEIMRNSQRSQHSQHSNPAQLNEAQLSVPSPERNLASSEDTARVRLRARKGHAASLLELVLPSGPSLVDPAAAASMEDLEGYTAQFLLRRGAGTDIDMSSRSRGNSEFESELLSPSAPHLEDPSDMDHPPDSSAAPSSRSERPRTATETVRVAPSRKVKTVSLARMSSSERNELVNKRPGIALDDLQAAHDEKARSLAHSNTGSRGFAEFTLEKFKSPMPFLGRVWLGAMGVLDLLDDSPCLQHLRVIWILCLFVGLLALGGYMMWQSVSEFIEVLTTITTACYMLGVLAGIWSLRRANMQELLGSHDGSLETYAQLNGFLKAWAAVSKRRFNEVIGFLIVMIACRSLVHLPNTGFQRDMDRMERTVAFCAAASGFAALAFAQLHIVAGLELAIDSFSVKFFQQMDMAIAIQDWNVVQATLRQVSMKLSTSLLLLGSSCSVSLLLLLEVAFLRTEHERGQLSNVQLVMLIAWLAPPLLLFLYVLMRCASVTEKASRVAPLVNSWQFDRRKSVISPGVNWMDSGRQYMVQYIRQSEAGFYLQGKRLYMFQVTKLCYYLVAFSMAMLSRLG